MVIGSIYGPQERKVKISEELEISRGICSRHVEIAQLQATKRLEIPQDGKHFLCIQAPDCETFFPRIDSGITLKKMIQRSLEPFCYRQR